MGLWLSRSHLDRNPEQEPELSRDERRECRVELHKAALQGNWKNAQKSLSQWSSLANTVITEGGETALHLAAAGANVDFVKRLLERMNVHGVNIKNNKEQDALCYAAIGGHVEIAKKILEMHGGLIGKLGHLPLLYAAWQGHKKMANYLFDESMKPPKKDHSVPPTRPKQDGESVTQARTREDQIVVEESVSYSRPEQDGESVTQAKTREDQIVVEESISYSRPEQDGESVTQARTREDQIVVEESGSYSGPEQDGESVTQARTREDQIVVEESISYSRPEEDGESVTQARTREDQIVVEESISYSGPEQDGESVTQARTREDQIVVEEPVSYSRPKEDQNAQRLIFHSWPEDSLNKVLLKCIHSGLYDLAVKIVKTKGELTLVEHQYETLLQTLARKPSVFRCARRQRFCCINWEASCDGAYKLFDILWEEVLKQDDIESPLGEHFKELLFMAAKFENDNFLIELIRRWPDFLYKDRTPEEHTIFHIAVLNRSVDVFNLWFELHGVKDLLISYIDNEHNTILQLPPQNKLNTVPGAALQMQREVLWYKEVEKVVFPDYITKKNCNDKTPHEMFLEEHKDLMKQGEKEIKEIAKACMLVTTLITTIVFTTAFAVPGGYNSKGAPILQHKKFFMVLPMSQAIGTLASSFSMLMFLSVLSSRFLENDFRKSLPLWLVLGVTSLFLSIVAMMVAFCRCIFFYELGLAVKVALLVLLAIVPAIFFRLKRRRG